MGNDIEKLYQQTIMDYVTRDELRVEMKNPTHTSRGHNPSCGDDLLIFIDVKDNKIKDISYIGVACAISSASVAMLIDDIKGKTLEDAKKVLDNFFLMMKDNDKGDPELLNDAILLKYVSDMPARVKCATLAWHTVNTMLTEGGKGK